MTSEKISPKVQAIHESTARFIADIYLNNLAKDTDATFGMLEGFLTTYRNENAAHVYRKGEIHGIYNIKFRDVLLASLARAEIRTRLENNATLANKLVAIRAKQKAKHDADIAAERATWKPFPMSA